MMPPMDVAPGPGVSMITLLNIYVAAMGLLVGSYLNVLIYRIPRGVSTVTPRSRCTRCRAAIRPWDNIPVLSYIFFLRGRCRHCGMRISPRYPAIELVTAILVFASWQRFGLQGSGDLYEGDSLIIPALIAAAFCCQMVVLCMIDFEHYLLPDVITLPGLVIGLVFLPVLGWSNYQDLLIGAVAGGAVLLAMTWGWYLWKGVEGMGMGDVKMLAMIGAWLGWRGMLVTLFLASFLGSIVGLIQILRGRMSMQSRLAFGVFLAIGAVITLFFETEFQDVYARFSLAIFRFGHW